MRIFKTLLALVAFTVLTYSCSSDDDGGNTNGDEQIAEEQNKLEDAPVALDNLNSDVSIQGATKNTGAPPASNSDINFVVNSNDIEAHQSSGFNLKFSSTEDVAGAYLQFKDVDGNSASNYFDIPSSELSNSGKHSNIKNKLSKTNRSKVSKVDDEYVIDIDFDDSFPPGQFCGDLCIYDSENNISQIVEVCVEVEAWGGNASIVGEWELESFAYYINGEIDDYENTTEIGCDNGEEISVMYDQVVEEYFYFTVENNGNFVLEDYEEYKSLDWDATSSNCSEVYDVETEKYHDKETGKWAYDEDDKSLTLVSFMYEDLLEPMYSETYPNGELLFEDDSADVEVIDGKLVVTQTYTEGTDTYLDIVTFKKR